MSPTEMASSQPLTFQRRSLQLAISCARSVQNLTVRVGWAQAFATSALMTANCALPQTGCGFSSPAPGNALQAAYLVALGAAACGAGAAQPTNAEAVPRRATVSNLGLKIRHHTDDLDEGSAARILFAHHHSRGDGATLQVTRGSGACPSLHKQATWGCRPSRSSSGCSVTSASSHVAERETSGGRFITFARLSTVVGAQ